MATILDQYGQAFNEQSLREPQTEALARAGMGLRLGRFSAAGDTARALTPAKVESLLSGMGLMGREVTLGEQAQMFSEMEERDAHLFAEMSKRRRALLTLDWQIKPSVKAGAAGKKMAAQATEWIEGLQDFEDIVLDLMDAVGHGFSALELEWAKAGSTWQIKAARHKPQSMFMLASDFAPPGERGDLRLVDQSIRANGDQGAPLWPLGWVVHIHRAKSGYLGRSGLYRSLIWAYVLKHFAIKDLAELLETYGLPIRSANYPTNATPQQKSALLRSLLSMGHNGVGIFPEGMSIELHDAIGGQTDGFMKMAEYMDGMMSKAVNGQTLSSGGDKGGSYALGMVHREVQMDILKSDAKQLAGTITRDIVFPLLMLNSGLQDMQDCPRFEYVLKDSEDLSALAEVIPKLVNAGVQVPESYVLRKFNIPAIEGDERVLEKSAAPSPFGGGLSAPAAPAALAQGAGRPLQAGKGLRLQALAKAEPIEDDTPAKLVEQLDKEMGKPMVAMMADIQAVVDRAVSLEALRDDLLALYGGMQPDALGKVMEAGFAVAALRGISEVKDEAL
jgi:phage gp29-like protein